MLKKILHQPNSGVLVSLFFFIIVFIFFLTKGIHDDGALFSLGYYVRLMILPLRIFHLWFLIPVLLPLLWKFGKITIYSFHNKVSAESFLLKLKGFGGVARDALIYYLPIALALSIFSFISGRLNIDNADGLKSSLILAFDQIIFGSTPFLYLGAIHFPSWFVHLSSYSFLLLPIVMPLIGIYLFVEKRDLFFEYSNAFILSFLILLPIWWTLPALDPRNHYVYNVYSLPLGEIESEVMEYKPQKEILEFQMEIKERQDKSPSGKYPTTTFPSAHTVWAVLLAYYSYKARKYWLWPIFPLAVFSTIGTFLFAFHYIVDIPAGIVCAVLAILLTSYLKRYSK